MTDADFIHAVNRLALYFNTKNPGTAALQEWFPRVAFIPTEAVEAILNRIKDNFDRMPSNLPKVFREVYGTWKAPKSSTTTAARHPSCRNCEQGILFLEKDGRKAAIFCACYRGNPGELGQATLAEMEARGWRSRKVKVIDYSQETQAAVHAHMQAARRDYARPDYRRGGAQCRG